MQMTLMFLCVCVEGVEFFPQMLRLRSSLARYFCTSSSVSPHPHLTPLNPSHPVALALGVSCFFGLAVSCIGLPLNHFVGKVVVGAQDNLMKARDERVALMNEVSQRLSFAFDDLEGC